eukprot:GFUD01008509.1.p1 GENE.GFUD01008509.1~~GFUD01008509.1.p1  ORF type:complete len:346 (-),score=128.55 GFUD01008509.1:163-1200(-)
MLDLFLQEKKIIKMSKRFKLKSDPLTAEEKFTKMKTKLESYIETHEGNASSFSKYLLESKLLGSESLDSSEVKELMEISKNVNLDWEENSEKSAAKNLREIESLTEIHVNSCQAQIVKVLDGSNKCVKKQKVEILPDKNDFPGVVLTQELETNENPATGEMPEITKLTVDIEGVEVDTDLEEAIKHCEDNLEPQLLTRLIQEYLPLNQDRQDVYTKTTSNTKHCILRSSNMIEFTNSTGSVLANVSLLIEFNKRSLSWTRSWMCKLTDNGSTACTSLHLPSELTRTGTVAGWDWVKAVETLGKVARLDAETPVKDGAGAWDASNVDTETPLHGQELKKRVPKRKL